MSNDISGMSKSIDDCIGHIDSFVGSIKFSEYFRSNLVSRYDIKMCYEWANSIRDNFTHITPDMKLKQDVYSQAVMTFIKGCSSVNDYKKVNYLHNLILSLVCYNNDEGEICNAFKKLDSFFFARKYKRVEHKKVSKLISEFLPKNVKHL